jgi:hypothetical protein
MVITNSYHQYTQFLLALTPGFLTAVIRQRIATLALTRFLGFTFDVNDVGLRLGHADKESTHSI